MVVDTTETDQVIQKVEVMEELEEAEEAKELEELEELEFVTEQQEQEERMTVIVSETPDRISFQLLISIMASYCNTYLGRNIFTIINAFK